MNASMWIWAVTLGLVTVVIVPLALFLLHRALRAARSIERYLRESLEAGRGIAENTKAVSALDETIAAAGSLIDATIALRGDARRISSATAPQGGAS